MLIFKCLTCKTVIQLIGVHDVRHHLNANRIAGKLSFPLRCGQSPDFKSTMACIDAFMKHYTKFHFTDIVPVEESFRQPQEILPGGISSGNSFPCNSDETETSLHFLTSVILTIRRLRLSQSRITTSHKFLSVKKFKF